MTHRLQSLFDACTQTAVLHEPSLLPVRIEAMERLEDELFLVSEPASTLCKRAAALLSDMEAVNARLYACVREDIRQGQGAAMLKAWARATHSKDAKEGYDALDTLISGVLNFDEPQGVQALDADMVFYQPTPARHVFDFMTRAAIDDNDVVMDLGSGLGHVSMLTAICTRARCTGIEIQPAYVTSARACAHHLHIGNAQFMAQDVRDADLSEGTVFYLYTPFVGTVLRTVLHRLRQQAERRSIRLCTLGPCTSIIAREPWLQGSDLHTPERPALWYSH